MFKNRFPKHCEEVYNKLNSWLTTAKLIGIEHDVSGAEEYCEEGLWFFGNDIYVEIEITKKLAIKARIDICYNNNFSGIRYETIDYIQSTHKYEKFFNKLEPYFMKVIS